MKKIKMALRELARGQGKMKNEKNLKKKNRDTVPFLLHIYYRVIVTCKAATSLKVWKQF